MPEAEEAWRGMMVAFIDAKITSLAGRRLVEASEVLNLLLDLRAAAVPVPTS